MSKKSKLPNRWVEYIPMGERIHRTRFIAFKCPLKNELLAKLSEDVEKFSVDYLLNNCKELKMVVDLTDTDRYYNSKIFENHKVQYEKLNTRGHFVPGVRVVGTFFRLVDDFLEENKDDDSLIGVHCTHGVNRTGYLICRYMIDRLNVSPKEAINEFNKARGHNIERENYIEDLYRTQKKSNGAEFNGESTEHQRSNYNNETNNYKRYNAGSYKWSSEQGHDWKNVGGFSGCTAGRWRYSPHGSWRSHSYSSWRSHSYRKEKLSWVGTCANGSYNFNYYNTRYFYNKKI